MAIAQRKLLALYRKLYLIRFVELELGRLFSANKVPGFIHLSIGQEATAVGVAEALAPGDTFATTHRGHGHALANGIDVKRFIAEILGKASGICKGRSGSMHVADMSIGMLGANGIVAAGIPLAVGSALGHQLHSRKNIAVSFFGDGALAEGVLHESFNIAALWKLPVLFVCENNGWSEFSRTEDQLSFQLIKLAQAYGIPAQRADGNDIEIVAKLAGQQAAKARQGKGPHLIEFMTTRHRGHFEGDPQRYRDEKEVGASLANDPVHRLREKLSDEKAVEKIEHEIKEEVEAALVAIHSEDSEPFSEALAQVYGT
jgi:pyruvate dehydrogenase E1 component alpha subunit